MPAEDYNLSERSECYDYIDELEDKVECQEMKIDKLEQLIRKLIHGERV
jgi:cell division protein FtsL